MGVWKQCTQRLKTQFHFSNIIKTYDKYKDKLSDKFNRARKRNPQTNPRLSAGQHTSATIKHGYTHTTDESRKRWTNIYIHTYIRGGGSPASGAFSYSYQFAVA